MILQGDALTVLKTMESESVQMCVTSPPYFGLRNYGIEGQIGLEETPEQYIERLTDVFREVRRVLKKDGTLWVNIGDSYAGSNGNGTRQTLMKDHDVYSSDENYSLRAVTRRKDVGCKPKDMIGIPWLLAFSLRADGWYLRQDIIWEKPNPMPESVKDRFTKAHEYMFLLSKEPKYYFNQEAVQEVATGYDGRKDTLLKGSEKYENSSYYPNGTGVQTMAARGHERWKFKNLADKGQTPNTFHLTRAEGIPDTVYPVRNKRDVWNISTTPYSGAHFATFPEALVEPCILAGSKEGDTVLDVFNGAATTGVVCMKHKREYIGIELNPEYVELSEKRLQETYAEFNVQINQTSMW